MNAGVAVVGAVLMRRSKVGLGKLFEEQVVRGWPGRNARATGLGVRGRNDARGKSRVVASNRLRTGCKTQRFSGMGWVTCPG